MKEGILGTCVFNIAKHHQNSPLKHLGNKRYCNEYMKSLERDWNWAIRPVNQGVPWDHSVKISCLCNKIHNMNVILNDSSLPVILQINLQMLVPARIFTSTKSTGSKKKRRNIYCKITYYCYFLILFPRGRSRPPSMLRSLLNRLITHRSGLNWRNTEYHNL